MPGDDIACIALLHLSLLLATTSSMQAFFLLHSLVFFTFLSSVYFQHIFVVSHVYEPLNSTDSWPALLSRVCLCVCVCMRFAITLVLKCDFFHTHHPIKVKKYKKHKTRKATKRLLITLTLRCLLILSTSWLHSNKGNQCKKHKNHSNLYSFALKNHLTYPIISWL